MERTSLDTAGCWIKPDFLPAHRCADLLAQVLAHRQRMPVPALGREPDDRPLRHGVIDGLRIRRHLPEVVALHRRVNILVDMLHHAPLQPLDDEQLACNITITGPGGSEHWHYDRHAVTAVVWLNAVGGGEAECCPNYRLRWPAGVDTAPQRWFDRALRPAPVRRLFGRCRLVAPRAGQLLVMRGDRCLHGARPVRGGIARVNIVMSFDLQDVRSRRAERLAPFQHRQAEAQPRDPDYRH